MSSYTIFNSDFSAGELSPAFLGRTESERYSKGLEICHNAIPSPLGCVSKRKGTKYVGSLPTTATSAALAIFDAGNIGRFIVEFTNNLIRFWNSDGTLVQHNSTDFSIVSTYTTAELPFIRTTMNKGVMYIVQGHHTPAKITKGNPGQPPFALVTCEFTGGRTFNSVGNYPTCQAFKGGRWYLASTDDEPNAIFASRTPDSITGDRFTDFTFNDVDPDTNTPIILSSHAIYLQESDMYGSRINWLINGQRMIAGVGKSIWMSDGAIPTPDTFDMQVTLQGGCSEVPPLALANYIIYADRGGTHLKIMSYSQENDGYTDSNISTTASHLLKSGIKIMSLMQGVQSAIWIVTNDNQLISCSFDPSSGTIGWASHPMGKGTDLTDMTVETLVVIPGNESDKDSLWLVVKREGVLCLERLDASAPEEGGYGNYLDSSQTMTFEIPVNHITIPRLANHKVSAVADNAILPDVTLDANGSATYDRSFSTITVGYRYKMVLRTPRRELPANGTSQRNKKSLQEVTIRLFESLGGKIGKTMTELNDILPIIAGQYVYNTAPELKTGDRIMKISSFTDEETRFYIISDDPMPFCLLAVMARFGITEA